MKPAFYYCIFIWLCTLAASGQSVPPVSVSPVIDTAAIPEYRQIVDCLNKFLASKNINPLANENWSEYDFAEFKRPFSDIYFIEFSGKYSNDNYYRPTLIEIVKTTTPGLLILKLAFIGHHDADGNNLRAVYNVLAEKDINNTWKLRRILRYNTRNWKVEKANSIRYVITPSHTLDLTVARGFHDTNIKVAKFFKSDPVSLTYYLCNSPEEVFHIRGFDYVHEMYSSGYEGNFELNNTIFSANANASNAHELVHAYLSRAGIQAHVMLTEGLATYIGGYGKFGFRELMDEFTSFIQINPDVNLYQAVLEGGRLDNGVYVNHITGAVMCHIALEEGGRSKLFDMLATDFSEDGLLQALSYLKIDRENFDESLRKSVGTGRIKNTLWQDEKLH